MRHYIYHYGIFGFIRLLLEKILTPMMFRNAKIIRRPFECRGRYNMNVGSGFTTGRYCRIEAHGRVGETVLTIGQNCQINDSVHIAAAEQVIIGDDVLIASRVFITDLNHGSYSGAEHSYPNSICRDRILYTKPVHIGSNVWLGEGVVVLPGTTIGASSIIGANAVVSRDIPKYSIAVGNPARVIKYFDFKINQWVAVDES